MAEGLGICLDLHLTGMPAGQAGVTIAGGPGGPVGYGRRHPIRAHERRTIDFDCTIFVIGLLEAAIEALAGAGADTAPLHRVFFHLDSLGLELVVFLQTTTLATSHHCVLVATAATADRQTLLADVHVEHLKSVLRHQSVSCTCAM